MKRLPVGMLVIGVLGLGFLDRLALLAVCGEASRPDGLRVPLCALFEARWAGWLVVAAAVGVLLLAVLRSRDAAENLAGAVYCVGLVVAVLAVVAGSQ